MTIEPSWLLYGWPVASFIGGFLITVVIVAIYSDKEKRKKNKK